MSPELAGGRTMLIKVCVLAEELDVTRRRVRQALAMLTALRLLECVLPATMGTPGAYRLGPAGLTRAARRDAVPPIAP